MGSEGPERALIEKKIKELSLEKNFHLLGFVENPESLLNGFDLYVSSSLKEGLPYSLISALSAGIPVISTNVGGCPEIIIDGENGLLIPPASASLLASAIVSMETSPDIQEKIRKNTGNRAHLFSLVEMIDKTLRIYNNR
jgi:glycosyltransferase involved in cell wall biosynthesis